VRAKPGIAIALLTACCIFPCAGTHLRAEETKVAGQAGGTATEDSVNDLTVAVGKSVLLDCAHTVQRVAVGMGDIAAVTAISPTEIMINGKMPGETSLIIWEVGGARQFFNVTVRASLTASNDHLEAVRREIRTELPGQVLKISSENGAIFLRGTVKDLSSSDRAVKIAASAGKVVNLLNVEVPQADPQILLKVRFASVDRSKSKQLGINLESLGLGNTTGSISTGQFSAPTVSSSSSGSSVTVTNPLNLLVENPGNLPIAFNVQALETKGVVEVLAEPNLMAANGKQASFLAGGEYPFPVAQGSAGTTTITIMFKEYGVRLNFIPTITPRGTIRLQVAPEVSSLDFTNAVEISGFEVPAISTRKVNTEVELSSGQSFVIGGLLDNRETETFEKIPFLGSIPVLGRFFQSMSKNKTNTELIVIVTPEIVAPIAAGAALPTLRYPEKFLPPNSGIAMHTPDEKSAETAPAPTTMPVEKLVEALKPETPLVIDASSGGFGAASTTGGGSGAAAPAPPQ